MGLLLMLEGERERGGEGSKERGVGRSNNVSILEGCWVSGKRQQILHATLDSIRAVAVLPYRPTAVAMTKHTVCLQLSRRNRPKIGLK